MPPCPPTPVRGSAVLRARRETGGADTLTWVHEQSRPHPSRPVSAHSPTPGRPSRARGGGRPARRGGGRRRAATSSTGTRGVREARGAGGRADLAAGARRATASPRGPGSVPSRCPRGHGIHGCPRRDRAAGGDGRDRPPGPTGPRARPGHRIDRPAEAPGQARDRRPPRQRRLRGRDRRRATPGRDRGHGPAGTRRPAGRDRCGRTDGRDRTAGPGGRRRHRGGPLDVGEATVYTAATPTPRRRHPRRHLRVASSVYSAIRRGIICFDPYVHSEVSERTPSDPTATLTAGPRRMLVRRVALTPTAVAIGATPAPVALRCGRMTAAGHADGDVAPDTGLRRHRHLTGTRARDGRGGTDQHRPDVVRGDPAVVEPAADHRPAVRRRFRPIPTRTTRTTAPSADPGVVDATGSSRAPGCPVAPAGARAGEHGGHTGALRRTRRAAPLHACDSAVAARAGRRPPQGTTCATSSPSSGCRDGSGGPSLNRVSTAPVAVPAPPAIVRTSCLPAGRRTAPPSLLPRGLAPMSSVTHRPARRGPGAVGPGRGGPGGVRRRGAVLTGAALGATGGSPTPTSRTPSTSPVWVPWRSRRSPSTRPRGRRSWSCRGWSSVVGTASPG